MYIKKNKKNKIIITYEIKNFQMSKSCIKKYLAVEYLNLKSEKKLNNNKWAK